MKLCSTANCTGIISTDSSAIRCLNCVRHDWKVRKQKFSLPDNEVSSPAMTTSKMLGKERTKKKGVTWADEETKSRRKAADNALAVPSAGLSGSTRDAAPLTANSNLPNCNPSERQPLRLRISGNARLSLRSRPTSAKHDNLPLVVQPTAKIQSPDVNFPSTSKSSTSPLPLVDDVNLKYLEDGSSRHTREERPSHPLPTQSESTVASTQTGWDSDLTELSDSAGEESESELRSVSDNLVSSLHLTHSSQL